jgi:hypothetical protein
MSDMFDDLIKQERNEKQDNRFSGSGDINNSRQTPFNKGKLNIQRTNRRRSTTSNFNVEELDLGNKRSTKNILNFVIPIIVAIILAIIVLYIFNIL